TRITITPETGAGGIFDLRAEAQAVRVLLPGHSVGEGEAAQVTPLRRVLRITHAEVARTLEGDLGKTQTKAARARVLISEQVAVRAISVVEAEVVGQCRR